VRIAIALFILILMIPITRNEILHIPSCGGSFR
jgi:hypothetical protein